MLSDEEMRFCQISRQKAVYLRALSRAVIEKQIELESLNESEETAIRKDLTKIKGIGNWTADIYLMFCLQKKDIFPSGDIAVMKSALELCGTKTKEEIIIRSEIWKPLRSLAAYYFWHYYLKEKNRA